MIANYSIQLPISKELPYQQLYRGFNKLTKITTLLNIFPKSELSEEMERQIIKRQKSFEYIQEILNLESVIIISYSNSALWTRIDKEVTIKEFKQIASHLYALYKSIDDGFLDFDNEMIFKQDTQYYILDYGLQTAQKIHDKEKRFPEEQYTEATKTWLFGIQLLSLLCGSAQTKRLLKCKTQKIIDDLIVSICTDYKASVEVINTFQQMIKLQPNERLLFKDLDKQNLFKIKGHEPKQNSIQIHSTPIKLDEFNPNLLAPQLQNIIEKPSYSNSKRFSSIESKKPSLIDNNHNIRVRQAVQQSRIQLQNKTQRTEYCSQYQLAKRTIEMNLHGRYLGASKNQFFNHTVNSQFTKTKNFDESNLQSQYYTQQNFNRGQNLKNQHPPQDNKSQQFDKLYPEPQQITIKKVDSPPPIGILLDKPVPFFKDQPKESLKIKNQESIKAISKPVQIKQQSDDELEEITFTSQKPSQRDETKNETKQTQNLVFKSPIQTDVPKTVQHTEPPKISQSVLISENDIARTQPQKNTQQSIDSFQEPKIKRMESSNYRSGNQSFKDLPDDQEQKKKSMQQEEEERRKIRLLKEKQENMAIQISKYQTYLSQINFIGLTVDNMIKMLDATNNQWILPLFLIFKRMYQMRLSVENDIAQEINVFNLSNFRELCDSDLYEHLIQETTAQNELVRKELEDMLIIAEQKLVKLKDQKSKDKMKQFLNLQTKGDLKDQAFVYLYQQLYGRINQNLQKLKEGTFDKNKYSEFEWVDLKVQVELSLCVMEIPSYDITGSVFKAQRYEIEKASGNVGEMMKFSIFLQEKLNKFKERLKTNGFQI